tara:strand:+ start:3424 stop:5154 length:1731 start_codon:yes stop_codon:yes gene_type:complete
LKLKNYISKIFFLLGDDKKKVPLLIMAFIFLSLIEIVGLGLIAPYISLISEENSFQQLNIFFDVNFSINKWVYLFSLLLVVVFVLKLIFSITLNYFLISFSEEQRLKTRTKLMNFYQNLPYEEYSRRKSSDYIFNIGTVASNYAGNTLYYFMKLSSDLIFIVFISIFLIYQNFLAFSLMASLLILFTFIYNLYFQKKLIRNGKMVNKENNSLLKFINESMQGFKEIKIYKIEKFFFDGLEKSAQKFKNFYVPSALISQAPKFLVELIFVIFLCLIISITFILDFSKEKLFATLVIFAVASLRLLPIISSISSSISIIRFNFDTIDIIFLDLKNEKKYFKEERKISNKKLNFSSLHLENISFKYKNQKEFAIENISLNIKQGTSVGIIGESGSGKTTLIDILLGILKPQEGKIFLDNDPAKMSLDNWRESIAYMPQEVFISDDSLKQNIALGEEEINIEKVIESINRSGLSDFLEGLEDGVDTKFGDRGERLSGGQRQRIALSRFFYKDRKVIFMDESTSSLDYESEKEINKEIDKLGSEYTKFIISHKKESVRNCDLIIKLKKGKIEEVGQPDEIL